MSRTGDPPTASHHSMCDPGHGVGDSDESVILHRLNDTRTRVSSSGNVMNIIAVQISKMSLRTGVACM